MKSSQQDLCCKQNHKLIYACIDSKCKSRPFFCQNEQCDEFLLHKDCSGQVVLKRILSRIETKRKVYNPLIEKCIEWCDKMVKQFIKLKESLSQLCEKAVYALQQHQFTFFSNIQSGDISKIISPDIRDVVQSLKNRPKAFFQQAEKETIKNINGSQSYILQQVFQLILSPSAQTKKLSDYEARTQKKIHQCIQIPQNTQIKQLNRTNDQKIQLLKNCGVEQMRISIIKLQQQKHSLFSGNLTGNFGNKVPQNQKPIVYIEGNGYFPKCQMQKIIFIKIKNGALFKSQNLLLSLIHLRQLIIQNQSFCCQIDDQFMIKMHKLKRLQRITLKNCNITQNGVLGLLEAVQYRYLNINLIDCAASKVKLLKRFPEIFTYKNNNHMIDII